MAEEKYIVFPVQTEALFVKEDMYVANQEMAFSEAPFFHLGKNQDQNADIPHTGEAIGSHEFSSTNLRLSHGLHLHWELPSPSTQGAPDKHNHIRFPAIPNRWLINRKLNGKLKHWIVESDYLYQSSAQRPGRAIAMPCPPNKKGKPYRFMGCSFLHSAWKAREIMLDGSSDTTSLLSAIKPEYFQASKVLLDEKDSDKGLTVMGYGNDNFSTFYPNCYSVLGFFDPEISEENLPNAKYEIIGWYGNPNQDPVGQFFHKIRQEIIEKKLEVTDLALEFEQMYQIEVKELTKEVKGMVAYSSLTFGASPNTSLKHGKENPTLSLGTSGPGALSARLAHKILSKQQGSDPDPAELRKWEKRLEGMQYFSQLSEREFDHIYHFQELIHNTEFISEYGGISWEINHSPPTHFEKLSKKEKSKQELQISYPENAKGDLDTINELQIQSDALTFEIKQMESQLFSDWYKYVQAIYPADVIRAKIPDLEKLKGYINEATIRPLEQRKFTLNTINARLKKEQAKLLQKFSLFNNETNHRNLYRKILEVTPKPLPNFYTPKEPEVVIEGELARSSLMDSRKSTYPIIKIEGETKSWDLPLEMLKKIKEEKNDEEFKPWESQPWTPFFLDWEVSFLPTQAGSNFQGSQSQKNFLNYEASYLTQSYHPPFHHPHSDTDPDLEHSPDWELKKSKGRIVPIRKSYSGRTYLSPTATEVLQERLTNFISKHILQNSEHPDLNNLGAVTELLKKHRQDKNKTLYIYLQTLEELLCTPFLSQSLGGFNMALIQRKPTLPFPVNDPVNFQYFRDFSAKKIAPLIGESLDEAPTPLQYFHPIRAGCLKIVHLALLDNFGRQVSIEPGRINRPTRLRIPGNPALIKLVPRLAQAARATFRWQNATATQNPICGWLMLNKLNNSIMLFESDGVILGQFTSSHWIGRKATLEIRSFQGQDCQNSHLKKMAIEIKRLLTTTTKGSFAKSLETTLQKIKPEGNAGPESAALLAGRPIAIIRAEIRLELKGGFRFDESWQSFAKGMEDYLQDTPSTRKNSEQEKLHKNRPKANYDKVLVPSHIGSAHKYSDGLIAYVQEIQEDGNDYHYEVEKGLSLIQEKKMGQFDLTPGGKGILLTLLVDPLVPIHLTTGILPVTELEIPDHYYQETLKRFEFESLPLPILSPADQLRLPLESGSDMDWIWTWKDQAGNSFEVNTIGWLEKKRFETFAKQADFILDSKNNLNHKVVWKALLEKSWIQKRKSKEHFELVPQNKDRRGETRQKFNFSDCPLPEDQLNENILLLIDQAETRIRKVKTEAEFRNTPNIIREGRIKLKPKDKIKKQKS